MENTDYKRQRAELVTAQTEAEEALAKRKAEAEKLHADGQPIPTEVKEDATAQAKRVAEVGQQLAALDREEQKRQTEDKAFLQTLQASANEVSETLETRETADGNERVVTRDTVDRLAQAIRDAAGSDGYKPRINPDSERLVMEMVGGDPKLRGLKAAEWERRALELDGRKRTVLAGVDAQGGYLVPEDNTFMNQIQMADAAYGGVARVARIVNTQSGATLPIPNTNANLFEGDSIAENTTVNETDLTFGEDSMGAHMVTSGRLSATFQAVQDAGVNLPMLLGMVAGEQISSREARLFIAGTGAAQNQARGLANQYAEVAQAIRYDRSTMRYQTETTNNADELNWTKLYVALKYAVNAGFRRSMNFALVLNDQLDQAFAGATVSATDRRPLFERWTFGNTARGDGIDLGGIRVLTDYSIGSHSVTTDATAAPFGWVGDFGRYWIRRVAGTFMIEDPYTGSANMLRRWVFGRRCDAVGLFRTAVAGRAARAGDNPAARQRSAAIEALTIQVQA